ncbi:MAG: 16S rRNA (guanine(527)-N(7))-methyltransferase RsmG [Eggerthellaceae bacterium]|nr:16S rRNA (guanine(527)-N(7))-methyltransferase RsmG [Eggerthellaceae bacterium]
MELTREQHELLLKHLSLVIEENKVTNLTRIDSVESGRLLHVEDSLAAVPECLDAPQGPVAELGTGGGFPGIPLAVATGRSVDLVDSVGKKTKALDRIIEKLGLSATVRTYNGRIEELALDRPEHYALVTARALTALPSLIELASPLLMPGGRLVALKSADIGDERSWARAIEEKVGMREVSLRTFTLSDGVTERSIIVYEKAGTPSVKLPRRPGMAQKRPYKK